MKKVRLSIVIVNYKVEKELLRCISTIQKKIMGVPYEVIVVENTPEADLSKRLGKYPFVRYIVQQKNIGFGAGNNKGAKYASGEYFFFLNPDTQILSGDIQTLLQLLDEKDVGIVAPLLVDKNKRIFKKQGTMRLTPLTALFSLSFIYKYFPKNRIANRFWLAHWNKKKAQEVDVVPGTAFLIKSALFKKIGGFDKNFFLFFEENDLCNRVKDANYKILIDPSLKVLHKWGGSTRKNPQTPKIFESSRKYYFEKYYGSIGTVTDILLNKDKFIRLLKNTFFIVSILIIALFLRIYALSSLMAFIPDQGWFYLSARDMVLTGNIPLVGPPTSHPWIHHGPLWTYTLALIFYLFQFNPVVPAYFIAILGVVMVALFYYIALKMFNGRVAVIASLLCATSPLIVMNARIPYHTSPIPFFVTLLFYLTFLWVKGNARAFPFIALLLGVLYNHEITTFVFVVAIAFIFAYGVVKKKTWIKSTLTFRIVIWSIVLFLIPMLPFILYDIHHGYKQTVGFLIWVGYRVVKFPLSIFNKSFQSSGSNPSTFPEFLSYYQELMFVKNGFVSLCVLALSIVGFAYVLSRQFKAQYILLCLFLLVSFGGLVTHRIPIEADTLLISPFFILILAIVLDYMMNYKRLKAVIAILLAVVVGINTYTVLDTNFFSKPGFYTRTPLYQRMNAVDKVIYLTQGKSYTIIGKGELSSFPVFLDPYRYLLWCRGFPPSNTKQKTVIQIWEKEKDIEVTKIK